MKPERRANPNSGAPTGRISDDSEPTMAHAHMPVWLFIALSILLFWAGGYLNQEAGGFNPQVYPPFESYAAVKAAQPGGAEEAMGREVFARTCALCHQPHGNGVPGQFPPLAGSEWVTGDPATVVKIIVHGLVGPITVKGVPFNAAMTPFGPPTLNEAEIAAVATFVRTQWGNTGSPVTTEQVSTILQETAGRDTQWTAAELQPAQ